MRRLENSYFDMAHFEYSPLKKGQIRLLTIDPAADPSEPISCRLATVELGVELNYRALSYVWGAPLPKSRIRLEGCYFNVTANLAAILLAIRNTHRATSLWVDALCINQGDNAEKSQQVAQMDDIYYLADEVVVWLGPSNNTTEADMEMFRGIEQCLDRHGINDLVGFMYCICEISKEAQAMMEDVSECTMGYSFSSSIS